MRDDFIKRCVKRGVTRLMNLTAFVAVMVVLVSVIA